VNLTETKSGISGTVINCEGIAHKGRCFSNETRFKSIGFSIYCRKTTIIVLSNVDHHHRK